MTDVTTPAKGLTLPGPGDYRTWGTLLNNDLSLIDAALGQTIVVNITGSTLISSPTNQYSGYQFTGTLSGVATITWSAYEGFLSIANLTSGGQALSVGISGGTFATIATGATVAVWSDGANFVELSASGGGGGSTTGTGAQVLQNTPTIVSPVLSGTVTGNGTIPNAVLVNSVVTVAGHTVALGQSITLQASDLSNGVPTGTGVVVLQTAPTLSSVTISSGTVTGLPNPVNPADAANKAYVDASSSGLTVLTPVNLATTGALAANTYANGTLGVGATLTGNSNGAITVDGVTPSTNNRILVKNEATQANNGVYLVTTVGSGGAPYVLTRTTDFDTTATMKFDSYTFVLAGTVNASSSWLMTQSASITVGTTAVNWTQFSQATAYTAGSGLTLTGTTFSLTNNSITIAGVTVPLGAAGVLEASNLNNGVTGTNSSAIVLATSPTIASPTFTGTVAGAGTIPNSVLVNDSVSICSHVVTLGGGNVNLQATDLSNSYTGTGETVLQTSPTIITPTITGTLSVSTLSVTGTATATNLAGGAVVSQKTATYGVLAADVGKVFNNNTSTGAITFNLPTAAVGYQYTFVVATAQTVTVQAATSATITFGNSTGAATGNLQSAQVGSSVTLVCFKLLNWTAIASNGAWTLN